MIILSTFAVYAQILNYDFINYDDNDYVTENEFVQKGITLDSVKWAFDFSENKLKHYWHPITWLSHMLDYQLFGLNAGLHHFSSLFIHSINAVLVFLILYFMTGFLWRSAFIASLFAVHPINVESVVWISERKNVLSTFFWLLTMLAYFYYVMQPVLRRYFLVVLFFIIGLMTKPILVALPFVLFLVDFWPLNRFNIIYSQNHLIYHNNQKIYPDTQIYKILIEKLPLFILSLMVVATSLLSNHNYRTDVSWEIVPLILRIENALVSYVKYIGKLFWPQNLAVLYPFPASIPAWQPIIAVVILVGISIGICFSIKKKPYLFIGWLWYIGTMVPVIGILQQGMWPEMADRFLYLPEIGIFMMFAWGIPDILSEWRYKKIFLFTSSFCLFLILMAITWKQVTYWENGLTLSRRAVNVTSDNWLMENNFANMLVRKGQYSQSIPHYIEALRINPDNHLVYENLISVLKTVSTKKSVAETMEPILSFYPKNASLYFITGKMFRDEQRIEQSIVYFEQTIQMNKYFIPAYYELATLYMIDKEPEKSLSILMRLLPLQPDSPIPYYQIARIYQLQKKDEKASQWYRYAVEKGYEPSEKEEFILK